ncbi:hypothetical protein [Nonomuraea rhizosphaerae]|uniref:hypothetical protein n=1 Tax=Nonomuraea rhizosphaerae TaxID=2665663 RepID=UPI001C5EF88D|nr:hypothetical protein [Nonomuraea rhizosphaerae]
MLVTAAGTASATEVDTQLEIRGISPNPVVVKAGSETTAYFDIGAGADVRKVKLWVAPAEGYHTQSVRNARELESWRFSVGFTESDFAGKWKAIAVAFDDKGKEVAKDTSLFSVEIQKGKAATRITRFTADPDRVRKGKLVSFSGRLLVGERGWKGVRREQVSIFYRPSNSRGWKEVASAETGRGGAFTAETRAFKSGTYKAVYDGSDEFEAATSRTEYVRVHSYKWRR